MTVKRVADAATASNPFDPIPAMIESQEQLIFGETI